MNKKLIKYKWHLALLLIVAIAVGYVAIAGASVLGGAYPKPSTCKDTDGGIVPGVKGGVYGFKPGVGNYSYSDVCVTYQNSTTTLKEWNCNGTLPVSGNVNCLRYANYTRCSSGACI